MKHPGMKHPCGAGDLVACQDNKRLSATKAGARNPESGYVLLLVFAMAAIVAVMLYMEMPRVAFEAQRDKEQLLMDRGHEYVRAVTLFVRKNNRFPGSIDDLEKANNMRFLRRRYVDPMTGKADWRLLHAGPGGQIIDSILNQKKTDSTSAPQTFITEIATFNSLENGDSDGVDLATRRRASDQPGAAGDPSTFASGGGGDPTFPVGNAPANAPASNSGYNGPVMVLPDGRVVPASTSGSYPTGPAPAGGAPVAGLQGATGATGIQLAGGPLPSGVAIQQNTQTPPGIPQAGGPPAGVANLLNQILTTPRPGGINGLPGGPGGGFGATPSGSPSTPLTNGAAPTSSATAMPSAVGGGIAGVASKRERKSIKTYNDRKKYNEWEFVLDLSKQVQQGAASGTGATRVPQSGQTPAAFPGGPSMPGQIPGGQTPGSTTPTGPAQ